MDNISMIDKTKEIHTEKIVAPSAALESEGPSTGVWNFEEDDDILEQLVVVDHPLKRSWRQRIGNAAYWLTHRAYRQEVREQAGLIAEDFAGATKVKPVLPPKTRDFHITKRRRLAANFAHDIHRQIQLWRLMRRIVGTLAITAADYPQFTGSSDTLPSVATLPPMPASLKLVEAEYVTPLGDSSSDSDFVPRLILDE